jgi:hypothetical protein
MRWLLSLGSITLGLFALRLSYVAYAKWSELIALGDPSGAEIFEVEFWPEAVVAVALIALGGFVAGRASERRGNGLASPGDLP